jgi:hypothetical protein
MELRAWTGQTAAEYATKLESNLQSLLDRAKSGDHYRAPPVRRVHIPKLKNRQAQNRKTRSSARVALSVCRAAGRDSPASSPQVAIHWQARRRSRFTGKLAAGRALRCEIRDLV